MLCISADWSPGTPRRRRRRPEVDRGPELRVRPRPEHHDLRGPRDVLRQPQVEVLELTNHALVTACGIKLAD